MQVIEYRDKYGFLLGSDAARRKLVYCPETKGLKHIEHCEKCKYFAGHEKSGLKCQSEQPNDPPRYYNKCEPLNLKNE